MQDEAEDVEEHPLVRNRSRHMSSCSIDSAKEVGEIDVSPPSSPLRHNDINQPQHNETDFHMEEVTTLFYLLASMFLLLFLCIDFE